MRNTIRGYWTLVLLLPLGSGCSVLGPRSASTPPPVSATAARPEVPALVNYLNTNAQKVQNLRARVDIDCRADGQVAGLDGRLACQKPRDFRLKGQVFGKPAVDLGSNSGEFWYWISQANPPYVYHCSYNDLSTGKVRMPFPFHPDLIISALGIGEYDPNGKYELRDGPKRPDGLQTLELIQEIQAATGEPMRLVTVFNRYQARPGEPQVLAYILQDIKGNLICRARVERVQVDNATKAVLPSLVKIDWPAQKLSMELKLSEVQTNVLDSAIAARLFQRTDLSGHESFDLARGVIDAPGGIRRAGAAAIPNR
jgi:hypothetical protein